MLRIRNSLMVAVTAVTLGTLGASCSEDSPTAERDDDAVQDDDGPATGGKKDATVPAPRDGGGSKSDASVTSGPKKDAAVDAPPGDAPAGDKAIPCDVQKLVEAKCGSCHGAKPAAGAPMSLVTLADFQGKGFSDDSLSMAEVAHGRVTETNIKLRMPPASTPISAAEQKTLSDWLADGAPAGEACSAGGGTTPTPTPDAGTPATGDKSGGISTEPVTYTDPDIKCYQFKAFAKSGDVKAPYAVPTTPDLYVAFTVMPEFQGTQYIKSMKTIIDNGAVLHHWLFFKQAGAQAKSVVENAIGAHPDGEMLAGWAPGGDDMYFDPDVGMQISGGVAYQLEMHYNNKTGKAAPDASGVEVCVTPNKPEHVAAVSWLGTDNISQLESSGTCTPTNTQPVHLIAGNPHMHVKGKHMKVVLTRANGTEEVIHDQPFDFNYQRQYILDVIINPGDRIKTTCQYTAPSKFGKGTNDEMCYFFSTHWPAGALKGTSLLGGVVHGPNTCM
jgi:hypothetical protein